MKTNVKIYAKTVELSAKEQIDNLSKSTIGINSKIRIMPDVHAGVGCTIGTTMTISDKVCPNLVGVDIGCGVLLGKLEHEESPQDIDYIIKTKIPNGFAINSIIEAESDGSYTTSLSLISKLRCFNSISSKEKERAILSIGTLGGGNHFIEMYKNGYISIHTGSRNIGNVVAKLYQKLSIQQNPEPIKELSYLTGDLFNDYLHDINIMQEWALENRRRILTKINMKSHIICETVHNYIDTETMILRKGAVSAKKGEMLVIPLNMRDGLMVCTGKGNNDWNQSAPHGAGRLYSRNNAKRTFNISEYEQSMSGIYSTCICDDTIDEAPFAYKDMAEIINCIEPTVDISKILKPIYNFKSK